MSKLAFIDHYDSFSFNVLDLLGRAGLGRSEIIHIYCDDVAALENLSNKPLPTLFGPGPHAPKDVPASVRAARALIGRVPVFGVCLGHQIFGATGGADIVKAKNPWHGAVSSVDVLDSDTMFQRLPKKLNVVSYNSLVVDQNSLSKEWTVAARNSDDEIMAMSLSTSKIPAWSVQFHPESFLDANGLRLIQNWILVGLNP